MKLDKLQEAYDEMFDFITDLPSGLDGFESDFDAAYKELLEAKSADVAPVVHAKWITAPHKSSRFCSKCYHDEPYKFADSNANIYNYCPHCGAKMDFEENPND